MFNVRLKLREPEGLIVPKGPNFSRARVVSSEIEGTKIQFRAPSHRPRRSNQEPKMPKKFYKTVRDLHLRSYFDAEYKDRGLEDLWRDIGFFFHSWSFCGPWFTGVVSELDLSFRLIKIINYPKGISLFHPRAFEQVIGDNLTHLSGHHLDETRGGIQEFNAPINWQPLHNLPVNSVKLEVISEDFSPHRTIKHIVYFPLANDLFARLIFWPGRFLNLPRSELDKRVSVQPMLDLMDKIINSIQLDLSPKAQAQQEAALAGLEDTSLITDFPPLKWDKLDEEEKQKILALESR